MNAFVEFWGNIFALIPSTMGGVDLAPSPETCSEKIPLQRECYKEARMQMVRTRGRRGEAIGGPNWTMLMNELGSECLHCCIRGDPIRRRPWTGSTRTLETRRTPADVLPHSSLPLNMVENLDFARNHAVSKDTASPACCIISRHDSLLLTTHSQPRPHTGQSPQTSINAKHCINLKTGRDRFLN